jgi:hypothetical protein
MNDQGLAVGLALRSASVTESESASLPAGPAGPTPAFSLSDALAMFTVPSPQARRQSVAAVVRQLAACQGMRPLLQPAAEILATARARFAPSGGSDKTGEHRQRAALHLLDLIEPWVAGLAWDERLEASLDGLTWEVPFNRMQVFEALAHVRSSLADVLERAPFAPWISGLDLVCAPAARSFAVFKILNRLLDRGRCAWLMGVLSQACHHAWSARVAFTIGWYGELEDYALELWPPVAEWVVSSLLQGKEMRLTGHDSEYESVLSDADGGAEHESSWPGLPFWWDPARAGLLALARARGLGQQSSAHFWPHAFVRSPAGLTLRTSGLAILANVHARRIECPSPGCRHSHTFLTELGCSRPCCNEVEPRPTAQQWLVAPAAIEGGQVELIGSLPDSVPERLPEPDSAAIAGHIRSFFSDSVTKLLGKIRRSCEFGRTRRSSTDSVDALAGKVRASVYQLLVLASLSGATAVDILPGSPCLASGWEGIFIRNLARLDGGRAVFLNMAKSQAELVRALKLPELPPLAESNFKVIKNRIKTRFERRLVASQLKGAL